MAIARARLDAKRNSYDERTVGSTKVDLGILSSMRDSAEVAAELLRSMGSSHRLMILCLLMDGPKTVTDICDAIDARQSLVSQHLIRLRQGGLVKAERRGNFVHYSLADSPAGDIIMILKTHFCRDLIKRNTKKN